MDLIKLSMMPANQPSSSAAYTALLEKNRRFLWNPFTQMKGYLGE